ncbi:dTDP-4-dehydro-6-deoxyglucose aminotransferase [bacterium (Candidatus Blackallbacteria) CG17_big_fil_post_rev_8_21_14_2_50_48_46]|uniref:dTDP-4-dehydro-6-deoxyglucose aminotransferase n=1 Tax=bacterium (Candidatus Blackallbacteria) CG17_big_fil_post_rev_8_21_14_2_50_48_46 TaxID=2014261 RepID=A0A2M7G0S3_9BACT|nr:MAG: dTDP-4-dehydro-6-deoxyglucose aminotransferase [bacterium (Candidatus Blackallbacteria) CG18_big_fil_WC_8_21_14_2_50_49_26]PIW15282.1 MAG: dTDP-4-dehydro-6-deoxyglucose aminotransferase [bacterium (Candidatus Blackallbacteria) CG17_big_fil_post_rev_8_21_14_2_50_48_46]PIW45209.1 MAG: dTDP-4-dehydro-6-deoxyglucose aminotransferase [bacterium (Candidatus Blackallbacteria) CG13_big_fil_rev_8_21_14_2_50_49_14]
MFKQSLSDLALFGGDPLFHEKRFVGRPNLAPSEEILAEIRTVLESRWLSNDGPQLKAFEAELADTLGVKHCLAVSNATLGLELLFKALDLHGEVIVPSFTFVATVHALQWLGIQPVFCDILPETHTLDPQAVERLITPQTSAILGVHLWGQACEVEALEALAKKYQLKLIFDAAHALGCQYKGRMIGGLGQAEVFSLHATKFVNSLEGGIITTQDSALAERLRLMRNFGFVDYDQVVELGINAKMNEICATVGRSSLRYAQTFIAQNRRNYQALKQATQGIPGLKLLPLPETSNFQYLVLELDPAGFGLHRDSVVELLHAENVIARRYFYPGCHRLKPYLQLYPEAGKQLPVTEAIAEKVMVLPTGMAVSSEEINTLGNFLSWIQNQAAEIQAMKTAHALPTESPF